MGCSVVDKVKNGKGSFGYDAAKEGVTKENYESVPA